MFGLGGKKSKLKKLQKKHEKLMQQAFDLSKTDRKASDAKYAEAEKVMKEMEALSSE